MTKRRIDELVNAGAVPFTIVEAAKDVFDPEPGQVWRARWNDRTLTVLVVSTGSQSSVRIVPAHLAPVEVDDSGVTHLQSLVAEAPLRIAVRDKEHVMIPKRVLDVALVRQTDAMASYARQISREPLFNLPPVAPDRTTARRYDTLERLMNASWAPLLGTSLREVLSTHAISPSEVAQALDLDAATTYAALKGTRFLDAEQMRSLSEVQDVPLQELLGVGPQVPPELVDAIDTPRHRWFVDRLRDELNLDEEGARTELARVAYALAARQTGSKQVEWANRLHHALASLLTDKNSDER